jgi:signal transduction histidine kinase
MQKSRFYLDELIADCVRAMRNLAAVKNIAVSSPQLPELLVLADEELLHRMLLNLIDNAVKFTAPGGRVTVDATVEAGICRIRVSDSGSGIAVEDQQRVFERFYRIRKSGPAPPENSSGAGLGLPIARWIAAAHGGSLELEKSDASGSTFLVLLPVATANASETDGGRDRQRPG